MVDKNQPGEAESDKTNLAMPGERKFDESTYFGYGPDQAVENSEATPAQASSKYLWMGFGVVLILTGLIAAVLIFTGQGAAETPAPATLSQPAAEGKALFLANNCTDCHAAEGRAGGTGPRLSTTGKSNNDFVNIVRRGRGSMPANTHLTDEELNKVIAYIRAIKPPPETK